MAVAVCPVSGFLRYEVVGGWIYLVHHDWDFDLIEVLGVQIPERPRLEALTHVFVPDPDVYGFPAGGGGL